MKKLLAAFLLLSFSVQAGMFESEPIKIFKNYPFDMHKTEFQKKFRQFGECQFNMGEDKLCADRGAEDLYGIPLNILVFFEKNRSYKIVLKTTETVNRDTYLELFRGMIKSGFELYEIKDSEGSFNIYDEIFSNGGRKSSDDEASKKLDALELVSDKTNKATLYYTEHSKMQKLLKSRQKFTSTKDIFSKVPSDIRFVEMNVENYKGMYSLELIFTVPHTKISTIDDRPAERF